MSFQAQIIPMTIGHLTHVLLNLKYFSVFYFQIMEEMRMPLKNSEYLHCQFMHTIS